MKFGISSYRELLKSLVKLDDSAKKLAVSFAVGVYISVSPFFGIHTILAIVLSVIFKLNKVSTIAGSWVNLPWTIPFVYYSEYKMGEFLLGRNIDFSLQPYTIEHYLKSGSKVFLSIFIGSVIEGVLFGVIFYFLLKYLIETYRRRKSVSFKR